MQAVWRDTGLRADGTCTREDVDFPPSPVPDCTEGDLRATAIRTCRALLLEGEHMHHCVAGRTRAALEGKVALYSVHVTGQPLTVELRRVVDTWGLGAVWAAKLA